MGYVLFGAPTIDRWHLHQQLARRLTARGHRVAVLTHAAAERDFFGAQGMALVSLVDGRARRHGHVPLDEFAMADCRLRGQLRPSTNDRRRVVTKLSRSLGALTRLLEADPPDVVLLHQGRSGLHRTLHYVAREFGCQVVHTGEGLMPGAMQWDGEGLDGDAAACMRTADDYRSEPIDDDIQRAALCAWFARSIPPPVSRRAVTVPSTWQRLRSAAADLAHARFGDARRALHGHLAARGQGRVEIEPEPPPPEPFVLVLPQAPDDVRLRLDADLETDPIELAVRTAGLAPTLGDDVRVAAALPPRGLPAAMRRRLVQAGITLLPPASVPEAAAAAVAVVTVNHPLALGAILAGTPVLCTGRTPYAVTGVARATTIDRLADDLPRAADFVNPDLRARFLSRYLVVDQLWCEPDAPDHNGLNGFVAGVEACLRAGPFSTGLRYEAGPSWPLEPART